MAMAVTKDVVASTLRKAGLYEPVRDAYHFVLNRSYWRHRQRLAQFYSQFVRPGGLVFDVGANVGEYTRAFLKLGARVVAVEPHPECAERLRGIERRGRLQVEATALGEATGSATLHLSPVSSHSTLSEEWIRVVENTPRLKAKSWAESVVVPVTTLDALIAKHGLPDFIKIDVEGYEPQVLQGLSAAPGCLSFEFQSDWPEASLSCLQAPCFQQEDLEWNFVLKQPYRFERAEWAGLSDLPGFISGPGFSSLHSYGDFFIRRAKQKSAARAGGRS